MRSWGMVKTKYLLIYSFHFLFIIYFCLAWLLFLCRLYVSGRNSFVLIKFNYYKVIQLFIPLLSTTGFWSDKWAATWQNQQNECAPSEDSDQPELPPSLIRVFAVRMKKTWVLSYPLSVQRRLRSDWANAQADLSLRWAHSHCVGFAMRRLKCVSYSSHCPLT